MRAAEVIREARLRAGLSQHELAARSGRDRSVIARWEQGTVAPSLETLVEIVRACGFDLPLELIPHEPGPDPRLVASLAATPERRLAAMLRARSGETAFDPFALIGLLERHQVRYVLVGALACVLHGASGPAERLAIVPARRGGNEERLEAALAGVERSQGEIVVVADPPGTRGGYDDLRRAATREPIGNGLRPLVASLADLARILAAGGQATDQPTLRELRRLSELQRSTPTRRCAR
ncbi:MAG: helix-turn-helix transcriptional regulator [Thermoleophilia bacterium]